MTLSPVGRFAPSPTGPLHFGSLLAALASFLDMRARQGRWLVRIEDLDPPREVPGASDLIIRTLDIFGLHWDGEIRYQSQRLSRYRDALHELLDKKLAYRCSCSRSELKQRGCLHCYDGHCRRHPPTAESRCAIRARYPEIDLDFDDRIQGTQHYDVPVGQGDFIIFRRDGLFAYQLAVVVDDAEQGVTDILRGADLIDETPRQLALQHHLNLPRPQYAHIPVLTNASGQKLSKQTFAEPLALTPESIAQQLCHALTLLGQSVPVELLDARSEEILKWAIAHWQVTAVPAQLSLLMETH